MPYVMVLVLLLSALILSLGSGGTVKTPAPEEAPKVESLTATTVTEPAPAAVPTRPWAHDRSDISPDPKAVFGSLENGMRYLIYPNAEPPARLSLRLHIKAGSLMEQDDQRGIAHFLEHMMFNGTRNYSAEELIPKMQRLGIAFGAHANAYTSFDETVYMLDLPDLDQDTMELAFTVMRDFGDGALLTTEEIDKERGVILAEKLSRDSVDYRLMQQQFSQLLPDSLISHRFPIGIDEVIRDAPRERFVDFYESYYSPARMTFVIVGDVDPASIEQRIRETFATMKNPDDPAADPDLGSVTPPEGIQSAVFHDPEVNATDVSLLLVRPHTVKPDTREQRTRQLKLSIAHSILNRRLERISKQQNSPVAQGSAYKTSLFNAIDLGSISITASDDRWQEVVPILETEFRRILNHGFTDAELAEAKSNVLNAAEQQVKQQDSRQSPSLATGIARSLNDGSVFSTPDTDLEITRQALDQIDSQSCHQSFVRFWQASGYHLVLTTKQKTDGQTDELLSLYEASAGTEVEAPTARAIQVFDYTDFGSPGNVSSQTSVADLGISQLVLDNGVRVNLKATDFEKGRIRISARIGSGKLSQPAGKPMLDLFAQAVFEGGGLGKHSNDELQRILAGKNVSSSLSIDEDAFMLNGSTTAADFATQCRVMCASLTDPGFREEALWQFQKAVPMIAQQLKHTPAGPQKLMDAWLHGGDSRYAVASSEQLMAYTIEDAKSWLLPELATGYLELSIVGDFEVDAIVPELLATFGALDERENKAPALEDQRTVKFPNAPALKSYSYESKVPQAIATTIWKTLPMRGNAREFRRLNVLADILANRLREEVREKLGASYSPNAAARGSDALDNMGYLISRSIGKHDDLDLLHDTMRELADQLSREGATADELDRSIQPILGLLTKSKRENSYWLDTVLSRSQLDPQRLELARSRDDDYQSITLEQINALAKSHLAAENALSITIKSE